MHITQERFDKLPAYARYEITRLERELEAAQERIAVLANESAPDTDTIVRAPGTGDIPLPKGACIRFQVAEHNYVEAQIKVMRSGEKRVSVHTGGSAGYTMAVLPQVSNVVQVALIEHTW